MPDNIGLWRRLSEKENFFFRVILMIMIDGFVLLFLNKKKELPSSSSELIRVQANNL
jgi:hypothetical protein